MTRPDMLEHTVAVAAAVRLQSGSSLAGLMCAPSVVGHPHPGLQYATINPRGQERGTELGLFLPS
jgi:hypothetical protein